MIMINGNWEQVKNLSDILIIVSENIGNEFANKVKEICGEPSEELQAELHELKNEVKELKDALDDYNEISEILDHLDERIEKLRTYINHNDDGSDFMKGMLKAYDMIVQ